MSAEDIKSFSVEPADYKPEVIDAATTWAAEMRSERSGLVPAQEESHLSRLERRLEILGIREPRDIGDLAMIGIFNSKDKNKEE